MLWVIFVVYASCTGWCVSEGVVSHIFFKTLKADGVYFYFHILAFMFTFDCIFCCFLYLFQRRSFRLIPPHLSDYISINRQKDEFESTHGWRRHEAWAAYGSHWHRGASWTRLPLLRVGHCACVSARETMANHYRYDISPSIPKFFYTHRHTNMHTHTHVI